MVRLAVDIFGPAPGARASMNISEELIARARRGDEEAFRLIFERYTRPLISFVFYMVGRREAAEELARAAAAEHRRLLEGYRVQESDARVRVAMDWALYRMGKSEALFAVVRALDSKQVEQAVSYLKQIEGPDPLYIFLERVNGNTLVRLLEVLAATGNAATLERVKPFAASLDPRIADAANFAEREITLRLEDAQSIETKRPRRTGNEVPSEP